MRRRGSAITWAVGVGCWAALAAASAGAVITLTAPNKAVADLGIDLVRSPAPGDPHWQLRPVAASSSRLFFDGGKGPRADIDSDSPSEPAGASSSRIELASASDVPVALVPGGSPLRAQALKSLANPARRAEEKICLAEAIYFEGRGQPVEAQIAVGQTVVNRAVSGAYPRTLCGVTHQRGPHDGLCQYSFACDGLSGISKDKADWELAQDLSERLLKGDVWLPEIGDATHSHPLAEHPAWVKYLQRVKRIGAIVFYRGDFAKAAAAN